MSTTEDETLPTATGSALDRMRKVREEVAADDEPLLIPLVAYDNASALRFDYPEGGMAQIRRALGVGKPQHRVKQDDEAELNAMADLMATCCSGVVEVHDDLPEREWPSVHPDKTLRINRTFAEMMGIEVPTGIRKPGRYILRHLYSPHAHQTGIFRGDPVLLADGIMVNQWLEAGGARATESLPGE